MAPRGSQVPVGSMYRSELSDITTLPWHRRQRWRFGAATPKRDPPHAGGKRRGQVDPDEAHPRRGATERGQRALRWLLRAHHEPSGGSRAASPWCSSNPLPTSTSRASPFGPSFTPRATCMPSRSSVSVNVRRAAEDGGQVGLELVHQPAPVRPQRARPTLRRPGGRRDDHHAPRRTCSGAPAPAS